MAEHDHDEHEHHDHGHFHHPHELQMPHDVMHDPKGAEIIRAWITQGNLSLALHAMAFGEVAVWGHVLAGIAQNVAHAAAGQGQGTVEENMDAISRVLMANLEKIAQGGQAGPDGTRS